MSRLTDALGTLLGLTQEPATIIHVEEAAGVKIDPDDHLYRVTGAGIRDLTGATLRRAQDLSIDLYRRNPLANRIVKIYTTFMAGDGFAISCDNPDVQAVTDEFWTAERNEMDLNHRRFARDWLLYGEGIHPVGTDDAGNTTIGFIDPQAVDKITTSPLNQLILEQVHLHSTGQQQAPLAIVRRQTDPALDDLGLLTGDTFAWLYDRIGAATRGTPFLLPILDWLDAYDQTLWELVERIKATRAFFWDIVVEGGRTEVEEAKKAWGTTAPRSGSARFRSAGITEINAQQPDIGAHEDVAAARFLLRHIATGAGLAPHWLGDPEDANRSTAEQMDVPVLRALQDTQAVWKSQMEEALRFVVDRKVAAGLLPAVVERHDEQGNPTGERVPAGDTVEVITPALTDDEIEAAAASLAAVAGAFTQLDMIDVIDQEAMRFIIRRLLPALGVPADELPEPDDDGEIDDEEALAALEALRARAERSGKLEELQEQL